MSDPMDISATVGLLTAAAFVSVTLVAAWMRPRTAVRSGDSPHETRDLSAADDASSEKQEPVLVDTTTTTATATATTTATVEEERKWIRRTLAQWDALSQQKSMELRRLGSTASSSLARSSTGLFRQWSHRRNRPDAVTRLDLTPSLSNVSACLSSAISTATNATTTTMVDMSMALLRRRLLIATEILTTERSYVESLDRIQTFYYEPLYASLQKDHVPLIAEKFKLSILFSNLQGIRSVNKELLRELEERLLGRIVTRFVAGIALNPGTTSSSMPLLGYNTTQLGSNTAADMERGSLGIPVDPIPDQAKFAYVVDETVWNATSDKIGDVFLKLSPFLKMYAMYVKNFQQALHILNQETLHNSRFRAFMQTQSRHPALASLPLQAYLIMPAQRIPRYRLLLTDLLRNTPTEHPDFSDLQKALAMIESIATFVNEEIRRHEEFLTMMDIQNRLVGFRMDSDGDGVGDETGKGSSKVPAKLVVPGRKFIKKGLLTKIGHKEHQSRMFFLFSDILVYASVRAGTSTGTWTGFLSPASIMFPLLEPSSPITSRSYGSFGGQHDQRETYVFHRCLRLDQIRVVDVQNTDDVDDGSNGVVATTGKRPAPGNQVPLYPNGRHAFLILSQNRSFQVYARSAEEKRAWMKELQSTLRQARQLSRTTVLPLSKKPSSPTRRAKAFPSIVSFSAAVVNRQPSLNTTDSEAPPPSAHDYCAPVWVPDEAANKCMICEKDFTFFRRKHHCRKCGQTFIVPGKGEDRVERACDPCYFEMFQLENEDTNGCPDRESVPLFLPRFPGVSKDCPTPEEFPGLPTVGKSRPAPILSVTVASVTGVAVHAAFTVEPQHDEEEEPLDLEASVPSLEESSERETMEDSSQMEDQNTWWLHRRIRNLSEIVFASEEKDPADQPLHESDLARQPHPGPLQQGPEGRQQDSKRSSKYMASLESLAAILKQIAVNEEEVELARPRSVTHDGSYSDSVNDAATATAAAAAVVPPRLRSITEIDEPKSPLRNRQRRSLRITTTPHTMSSLVTDFSPVTTSPLREKSFAISRDTLTLIHNRPRQNRPRSQSASLFQECQHCGLAFHALRWKYECFECKKIVCSSCASRKKLVENDDPEPADDSTRTLARICDLCFYGVSPRRSTNFQREVPESSLRSLSSLAGPLSPNRIKVGTTIRYRSRKRYDRSLLRDDLKQKAHLTMLPLIE